MKQSDDNPRVAGNWSWPEKTWFRERLNAVKAREHETQRKPADSPKKPTLSKAQPGDETEPEED